MDYTHYRYLRIEGQNFAENTMHPIGVFGIFRKLMNEHTMEQEDADLFCELDNWIAEILPYPKDIGPLSPALFPGAYQHPRGNRIRR